MRARCGKCFVVALLVLTTGLHWAALQTVAWAAMLAANLRTHSVAEAVSDTFDGQHLCPLCRAIAAAQKSEKRSAATPVNLKLEFPPLAAGFVFFPPSPDSAFSTLKLTAPASTPEPPVPPPRGCFI